MDSIDLRILEILQTDCMKTAKEMAAELSLTTTPIYERIKKLENAGYIKDYVAILNPDMIGKNILVFLNITLKEHHLSVRKEFLKRMQALTSIIEFYHVSGKHDYIAKARFSTIKEYSDFLVKDVASIPNIGNIESQIVLEEIKSTTKIELEQI